MITKNFINKKIQKKYMSYYTLSLTQQTMKIDIYKKANTEERKLKKEKNGLKNRKHK